jgi:hypothetical protein
MQITSENAAENVIQITSVIVQRIYADYTWNDAQNLLEEYKKEENERKKEPTRSLVKFTTVGLGNELVIFPSGWLDCSSLCLRIAALPPLRRLQISNWDQNNPLSLSLVDSGVYSHVGASYRCGYNSG